MKTLLILISILFITSCVPYHYLNKHHEEICSKCIDEYTSNIDTTGKVIIRVDTIYRDVSENLTDTVQIYLKCDSLGNVVLIQTKQLSNSKKIISQYFLNNNILTITNRQLKDSILILQTTIEKYKNSIQIIEKPIIKEKIPVWIYWVGGIISLFLIILLILVYKK